MIVFDSNIIIYSFLEEHKFLRELFDRPGASCSAISKVEVLGFTKITYNQISYFSYVFSHINNFDLDDNILYEAIHLRQSFKLSLGDSLVAATALIHQAPLYTRNTADFARISTITVVNPFV